MVATEACAGRGFFAADESDLRLVAATGKGVRKVFEGLMGEVVGAGEDFGCSGLGLVG